MRTYESVLVACVLLCWFSVAGALNQALFKVHQGYEVTGFYDDRSAQSLSRCATYCNMSDACFTATFDVSTKQCQLSDQAVWMAYNTGNLNRKTLYLIQDTETCQNPPAIRNGTLDVTLVPHGSNAVLTCDQFYKLDPFSPTNVNCTLKTGWGNVTGMACDPVSSLANHGTSFVMAFMKNGAGVDNVGVPTIMISGPSTARIRVEIPCIGIDEEHIVYNVLTVTFPIDITMTTPRMIAQKAVFITSDIPVQILCLNFFFGSSDGSVVFPRPSLGKEYFLAGHRVTYNGHDEFLIICLNDGTLITLQTASGETESITLNANDTYFTYDIDITGTKVSASKPIFLISGHMCANIPDINVQGCDYIDETMPPVTSLGTIHIISFMKPRPDFTISIVATEDSTNVSIFENTGILVETIFNLMQRSSVFRSYNSHRTISVVSTKPIMVHQYGHGSAGSSGDPSMMFIPDVRFFGQQYDFVIPSGFDAPSTITLVIAASLSASMLEMNGHGLVPTQSVSVSLPTNEIYTVLYADVMAGHNNLTHQSASAFGAWVYGRTQKTEFAWSLGYAV